MDLPNVSQPAQRSFAPPFSDTDASRASRQTLFRQAKERVREADVTLTTAEGDRVSVSAAALERYASARYQAETVSDSGVSSLAMEKTERVQAAFQMIEVEGELNETELKEIGSFFETLDAALSDMEAGDTLSAVHRVLEETGTLSTIASFDATLRVSTREMAEYRRQDAAAENRALPRVADAFTGYANAMADHLEKAERPRDLLAPAIQSLLTAYAPEKEEKALSFQEQLQEIQKRMDALFHEA